MNVNIRKYLSVAVFITTIVLCTTVNAAKPAVCAGSKKVCTKDQTYDKTIDGKEYSCYDCKQTVCKDGGNSLIGSQSSSVCSEKVSQRVKIIEGSGFHSTSDLYVAPKNTRAPKIKVKAPESSKSIE